MRPDKRRTEVKQSLTQSIQGLVIPRIKSVKPLTQNRRERG